MKLANGMHVGVEDETAGVFRYLADLLDAGRAVVALSRFARNDTTFHCCANDFCINITLAHSLKDVVKYGRGADGEQIFEINPRGAGDC